MKYDRPETWLTEKDRLYLMESTLPDTRQAKYERKKGARRRIKNGLLDLPAVRFLPRDERRKIFDDIEQGDGLYHALVCGVSLAKYACDDAGVDFEAFIEEAMRISTQEPRGDLLDPNDRPSALEYDGRVRVLKGFDVDITANYTDAFYPPRLRQRFMDGEDLDPDAMLALVESDEFDEEAFRELQRRREGDEDGEVF